MAGKYNDYDNVEDFVQHYMIRMGEQYDAAGRPDIANGIYDALNQYMLGEIDIRIVEGQPYIYPIDITGLYLPPSPEEVDSEDENMP